MRCQLPRYCTYQVYLVGQADRPCYYSMRLVQAASCILLPSYLGIGIVHTVLLMQTSVCNYAYFIHTGMYMQLYYDYICMCQDVTTYTHTMQDYPFLLVSRIFEFIYSYQHIVVCKQVCCSYNDSVDHLRCIVTSDFPRFEFSGPAYPIRKNVFRPSYHHTPTS